jgi:hypothetical protein
MAETPSRDKPEREKLRNLAEGVMLHAIYWREEVDKIHGAHGETNFRGEPVGQIKFTVCDMEETEFKRERGESKVISATKTEIEIATGFPLQARQLIFWEDEYKQDTLHFAVVKWAKKTGNSYRVGLSPLQ